LHSNPTNTQNLEELEEIVIAKDFEEYESFRKIYESKKETTLKLSI
jgi:hypothetical protein